MDPEIQALKKLILEGREMLPGYEVQQNRVLFNKRLVLPRDFAWIPRLFKEFHESAVGGHSVLRKHIN